MLVSLLCLLVATLTASATAATSLTLTLPPHLSTSSLPPSTHAIIRSGSPSNPPLTARLRRDNTLRFLDLELTPGSYLLDVYAKEEVFAPMRMDVQEGGVVEGVWETFWGGEWADKGGLLSSGGVGGVVIELKMLGKRAFYEERSGFSPLSLLKNPMILIAVAALAFTVGMPYLMDSMDPELRAEFEEQQKSSPLAGLSRTMQGQGGGSSGFDLASWMAGAQKPGEEATGSDAKEGGGGGARRR